MKKKLSSFAVILLSLTMLFAIGACNRAGIEESRTGDADSISEISEASGDTSGDNVSNGPSGVLDNSVSVGSSSLASGDSGSATASRRASSSNKEAVSSGASTDTGIPYITKGLYARWDFEDSGNIGKDASGNGHHLVVWKKGGDIIQTPNTLNSKLGMAAKFGGKALLASGTPAQAKSPYTDFIDAITGSYTLTFFAKNGRTDTPALEDHNNLFCNGLWSNPTSPYLEFAFTYMQDGGWNAFACYLNYGAKMNGLNFKKFAWQADNGSFYKYGELDTEWYHYAVTVDKSKVQVNVYIDGKLIKSNSPGTQELSTQSTETLFSIGGMALPDEDDPVKCDCFIGVMDDFRVYDRALTVYEIGNIAKFKG